MVCPEQELRHPLFTNQELLAAAHRAVGTGCTAEGDHTDCCSVIACAALNPSRNMPCRKESFLLLEQSVTVGSQEVDSLVARIGEALQLNAHRGPTSCSKAYSSLKPPPPAITRTTASCSCVRGRTTPYPVCTPRGAGRFNHQNLYTGPRHQGCGGNKQLCGRGWIRSSCRKHGGQQGGDDEDGGDEDPHQLLQELLLSGNLIKEAVRRLHLAGESPATPGPAVQCKVTEEVTTVQ